MTHILKPKDSEVNAYVYIKQELENLWWIVKNPARNYYWEVYQQNECLANSYLKSCLDRDMPEAVVKISENEFWVIESKRNKDQIEKALKEAKEQYAKKINTSTTIKCSIISWVAGNDTDWYTVINQYLNNWEWETILFNSKTKNILLSKDQVNYILKNKTINYKEFPDIPEEKYIETWIDINELLHNYWINKNKRARFLAWLILALSLNSEINLREDDTTTLVENVNTLIKKKLREVKKDSFFDFLKLEVPPVQENHIKYRLAIKETLKKLDTLDIRNAMASWNDILWKFYETFLKYWNWAKEIWIVLTPRHLTSFAVEVLDIKYNDFIFDPACWTGWFLVSAFDYVKLNSDDDQLSRFKNYNIFWIEQEDEVVALALVNMIFRWDWRNNMSAWNCFYKTINKTSREWNITWETKLNDKRILDNKSPLITKVLMNPPFALKKWSEKESNFIDYALSQMENWGLLFAIIPISVMVESSWKNWRKELLNNNKLLSVITFPDDLFYPVSVWTVWIFIKKWVSHNFEKDFVYFARAITDWFKKKKWKRIEDKEWENKLLVVKEELKNFINNTNSKFNNIPEFKKICLLDKNDKNIELVPEAYIDSKLPTFEELQYWIDEMIRESVAFKIKYFNKLW